MKDFFYKKNDILIVLVILIIAGCLIYNRIGAILDYPAKLAEEQASKAQQTQEIDDTDAADEQAEEDSDNN